MSPGEPGSRKYPMPDRSHAANAKARASQQEHKGEAVEVRKEEKIDAKADRVLGRKDGGRAGKGKMSVNIVIAPGGQHPQGLPPPMAAPQMLPPRPPHAASRPLRCLRPAWALVPATDDAALALARLRRCASCGGLD